MAGSYEHLLDEDESEEGKGGWPMIENMRDAWQCVEELWWLVERAIGEDEAKRLLRSEFYPMKRGELEPDAALLKVKTGMERWD